MKTKKRGNTGKILASMLISIIILLALAVNVSAQDSKKNYVSDSSPLITIDFDTNSPITLIGDPIILLNGEPVYYSATRIEQNESANSFFFLVDESTPLPDNVYDIQAYAFDIFGNVKNYSEQLIVDSVFPEITYLNPENVEFISGTLALDFNFSEQVIFDIVVDNITVIHNDVFSTDPNSAITSLVNGYALQYQDGLYKFFGDFSNGNHKLQIVYWDYAQNGKVIQEFDFVSFDGVFRLLPQNYPFGFVNQDSVDLIFQSPIETTCTYKTVELTGTCGESGYIDASSTGGDLHTFSLVGNDQDKFKLCYSCLDAKGTRYFGSELQVIFDLDGPVFSNTRYDPKTALVTTRDIDQKFKLSYLFSNQEDSTICKSYDNPDDTTGLDINDFVKSYPSLTSASNQQFVNNHNIIFNDLTDQTSYTKYIRCMNFAGTITDPHRIDFEVDSTRPLDFNINNKRFTNNNNVQLSISNNQRANSCTYSINGSANVAMQTEDNFDFVADVTLQNDLNTILFECVGKNRVSKNFEIIVDKKAPSIDGFVFKRVISENSLLVKVRDNSDKDVEFELNFTEDYSSRLNITYRVGNSSRQPNSIINMSNSFFYDEGEDIEISLDDLVDQGPFVISILAYDEAGNTNNRWIFSKSVLFSEDETPLQTRDAVKPTLGVNIIEQGLVNTTFAITCFDAKNIGEIATGSCKSLRYLLLDDSANCNFSNSNAFYNIDFTSGISSTLSVSQNSKLCAIGGDFAGNKANLEQVISVGSDRCVDKDGDGFGYACASGYDCDDTDPASTNACTNGCLLDMDGDGFGLGCSAGNDCNDADANQNNACTNGCLVDIDGDGFGLGCFAGFDCDEASSSIHAGCSNSCKQDIDGDGFGLGCASGNDCNDLDITFTNDCTNGCEIDGDGDGFGFGCVSGNDCNDQNYGESNSCTNGCIIDTDGDGYGFGCSLGTDCDEQAVSVHENCANGCIIDADMDGFGLGCAAGWDCNDLNISISEGCANGCKLDSDGDGYGIGCEAGWDCNDINNSLTTNCTNGCVIDTDGDGFGWNCDAGWDCNDVNPNRKQSECDTGCIYDFDGDGFGLGCFNGHDCDETEIDLSKAECTSDCLFDDDCDGMDNIWEDLFGSNKNVYDANDKITNLENIEEYRNNPSNPRRGERVEPTTPVTVNEPTNPFIWALIAMLIVLIVAFGGWYIYKKYYQKKPEEPQNYESDQGYDDGDFVSADVSNDYQNMMDESQVNDEFSSVEEEIEARSRQRSQARSSVIDKMFGFVMPNKQTADDSAGEKGIKPQVDLKGEVADYIDLNDLKRPKENTKKFSEFERLDQVIKKHGHKVNNKLIQKLSEKDRKLLLEFLRYNKVKVKDDFIDIDEFRKTNNGNSGANTATKNTAYDKVLNKYDIDDPFNKLSDTLAKLKSEKSDADLEKVLAENKLDKKLKKQLNDNEYQKIIKDLKKISKGKSSGVAKHKSKKSKK